MTPKRPPVPHPSTDPGSGVGPLTGRERFFLGPTLGLIVCLAAFLFLWMLPMGVLSEIFNRDLANAESGVEVWSELTFRADLDLVLYTLLFDYAVVAILTTIVLCFIGRPKEVPGEKDPRKYTPSYRKAR